MKAASIRDVAHSAGVSTATVSRTLSNPEQVSEETRNTVMAAIEKTGYRVNRAARNLRKRQSGEVLVLLPDLGNPFFSQILSGIEETFSTTDYNVLIADSKGGKEGEDLLAEYLATTRADGIIIMDGQVSERARDLIERQSKQQCIVFACEWSQGYDLPVIRSNNRHGAALAMRYLYDLGHRHIAHITGPENNLLTHFRKDGVQRELENLKLTLPVEWMIGGDFSLESGWQAAQQIISMQHRPSAIFCASDQMAFGLIAALHAADIRVPDDISVIGFDDIELAEYYVPRLTTIRQNRRALGATAAQRILAGLSGNVEDSAGKECVIEVELVIRDSCKRNPRLKDMGRDALD